MALTINQNLSAISTADNLSKTYDKLNTSNNRQESGVRPNGPADETAGQGDQGVNVTLSTRPESGPSEQLQRLYSPREVEPPAAQPPEPARLENPAPAMEDPEPVPPENPPTRMEGAEVQPPEAAQPRNPPPEPEPREAAPPAPRGYGQENRRASSGGNVNLMV